MSNDNGELLIEQFSLSSDNKIMDLPILKEIFIPKNSKEALWSNFENFQWGKHPTLLIIDQHPPDYQRYIFDILIEFFEEKSIGPILPYPCYLFATQKPETIFPMQVFTKKNEIPNYYRQKSKKPHLKETELLDKINLKLKQFEQTNFFLVKEKIQEYGRSHRFIHWQSLEGSFYEQLLKKLKQNKKRGT